MFTFLLQTPHEMNIVSPYTNTCKKDIHTLFFFIAGPADQHSFLFILYLKKTVPPVFFIFPVFPKDLFGEKIRHHGSRCRILYPTLSLSDFFVLIRSVSPVPRYILQKRPELHSPDSVRSYPHRRFLTDPWDPWNFRRLRTFCTFPQFPVRRTGSFC